MKPAVINACPWRDSEWIRRVSSAGPWRPRSCGCMSLPFASAFRLCQCKRKCICNNPTKPGATIVDEMDAQNPGLRVVGKTTAASFSRPIKFKSLPLPQPNTAVRGRRPLSSPNRLLHARFCWPSPCSAYGRPTVHVVAAYSMWCRAKIMYIFNLQPDRVQ